MSIPQAKTCLHGKVFKSTCTDTKSYCHVAMSDVAWRAFLKNHYKIEFKQELGGFLFISKWVN